MRDLDQNISPLTGKARKKLTRQAFLMEPATVATALTGTSYDVYSFASRKQRQDYGS